MHLASDIVILRVVVGYLSSQYVAGIVSDSSMIAVQVNIMPPPLVSDAGIALVLQL